MIPTRQMNDGNEIPCLGVGTGTLDDQATATIVEEALARGYRHIDTAVKYGNESGVGEGIRRAGVSPSELFVTTKLDANYQGDEKAVDGLQRSLERLGLERINLLLIHWPAPWLDQYVSTWRTFERIQQRGLAASIGVSNFKPAHLDRLAAETGTTPVVNQIELNPHVVHLEQRAYNTAHGIVTESWSPLGGNGSELLDSPILARVAQRHDKTAGQVVLRWHIQLNLVVIPRTSSTARLSQNLEIFDFELDDDDMALIGTLSAGPDAGLDSDVDGH